MVPSIVSVPAQLAASFGSGTSRPNPGDQDPEMSPRFQWPWPSDAPPQRIFPADTAREIQYDLVRVICILTINNVIYLSRASFRTMDHRLGCRGNQLGDDKILDIHCSVGSALLGPPLN